MFPGGLNPRRFSLELHLDGSKLPYLCFRIIGYGPNSWFGRITHDAPGGSPLPPPLNIFSDSSLDQRCWRADDE